MDVGRCELQRLTVKRTARWRFVEESSRLSNKSVLATGRVRASLIGVVVTALFTLGYGDCLAQGVNSPRLFAPGIVSGPADDLSPAFAPDGKSVYFTRANPSASTIVMSTLAHEKWSAPTVASFSGQWSDLEPAMAPDGSFLIFASNRPSIERQQALDGNYNGKTIRGVAAICGVSIVAAVSGVVRCDYQRR
jgi:WD40-like Beta Propeller Repeat